MRLIHIFRFPLIALALTNGLASAHLVASSYSLKGGEKFFPGQKVKITYTIEKMHAVFDIDFSKDGGVTYETITRDLPKNTVSYDWTVPNTATSTGRIRVFQHETGHPRMTFTDNWNLVSPNFTIEAPTSISTPMKSRSSLPSISLSHGRLLLTTGKEFNSKRTIEIDVLGHQGNNIIR